MQAQRIDWNLRLQASQADAKDAQAQHLLHRNASFHTSSKHHPTHPSTHHPTVDRHIEMVRFRAGAEKPHRHSKTDATSCGAQTQQIQQRPQHETHKHRKMFNTLLLLLISAASRHKLKPTNSTTLPTHGRSGFESCCPSPFTGTAD